MYKRTKAIEKYYINLQYESNKQEALIKISTLHTKIRLVPNILIRVRETLLVILDNLSLFECVFEHIDMCHSFIYYLYQISNGYMFHSDDMFPPNYLNANFVKKIISTMFALFDTCAEQEVRLFLQKAIFKYSPAEHILYYNSPYESGNFHQNVEMILLHDADLYAVIEYLQIISSMRSKLQTIWVQESIKHTFLSLIKKYLTYKEIFVNFNIHTFRSKTELTKFKTFDLNIVSIWSEDVRSAKCLAINLNKDILFINSHMDFYGGMVLMPYSEIYDPKYEDILFLEDECVDIINLNTHEYPNIMKTYDLFYDDMWQKPIEGKYWQHNNTLWAYATNADVKKCIRSAKRGFQIWSTWTLQNKRNVLCTLAYLLSTRGKEELMHIVLNQADYPYLYYNRLSSCDIARLEIITIRAPKGIVLIKKEYETELFYLLLQNIIIGNVVIIICTADTCSLAPYCELFSLAGIPPGVINFLSRKNLDAICDEKCKELEDLSARELYLNLTKPKQIILPIV